MLLSSSVWSVQEDIPVDHREANLRSTLCTTVMLAVQLHVGEITVFEGVFATLEGELLRSLDRAQFGQGFRWGSAC